MARRMQTLGKMKEIFTDPKVNNVTSIHYPMDMHSYYNHSRSSYYLSNRETGKPIFHFVILDNGRRFDNQTLWLDWRK